MEALFRAPFPKSRPDFLRRSKRSILELDGYNQSLGIAFEYQGIQHFEPQRHLGERVTVSTQEKDDEKRRRCWENGVSLVIVVAPIGFPDKMKIIKQVEFAVSCAGLKPIRGWKSRLAQVPSIDLLGQEKPVTAEMLALAHKNGGELVSTTYRRARDNLT